MDAETTIIGAGPYGLSIAAHLRAAGVPFEILGTPLESWRTYMPEGMVLKSERFASNLWDPDRQFTLQKFCDARGLKYQPVGDPLSLATFLDYAEWFRRKAVGETRDTKVTALQRASEGFRLTLADGSSFSSRRVILATGHLAFQVVPDHFSTLSEPAVLHTARVGDVRQYAGRSVCIVGAGQSALETAAILHENGARVTVLVRRARVEWNPPSKPRPLVQRLREPDAGVASGWKAWAISEMPRTFRWYFKPELRHWYVARAFGPSGSWWLRARVENRVDIRVSATVKAVAATPDGKARLQVQSEAGLEEMTVDHLIAGTGYRVDIDRIKYLDPALRSSIAREAGGIPALSHGYETSVPGLYMVGVVSAPVFGPIMRFMYGAKHVAPVLSRRLCSAA